MKRKILLGVLCSLIGAVILVAVTPKKPPGPELLAISIIGCWQQDPAVAIARALSTRRVVDTGSLSSWAGKNGCDLVPAGTYVTPIQEEAGHKGITKASVGGREMYLLGLPRPTSQEKLDMAIADLKQAVHGNK